MSLYKHFLLRGILAGAIITTIVGAGAILFNAKQTHATSSFNCDSNAVLYCGAPSAGNLITQYDNNGSTGHTYSDLHAIYNSFGITSTGIHSLADSKNFVIGQVHKDGTVWMNGKQIGGGAMTAGRVNFAGSTPIPGTHAFMRPPSVSFNGQSLDAYVALQNGQPTGWAVLVSCGNPVKFQRPQIKISKQVQSPQGIWGENAEFQNGAHIRYLVTVTNTGQAQANNVMVADLVPAGQTYDKGSTKVEGSAAPDGINSFLGINIGALAPGASVKVTFSATAKLPETACGPHEMTNTARAAADTVNVVSDTAKANVKVNCVAQCSALTASGDVADVGEKITFTTKTVTKGATAEKYVFKVDGKVAETNNSGKYVFMSHAPGEHTVSVTVTFSDGTTDGGSGSCAKNVKVKQKAPVISCDSLTASKTDVQPGEQIVFTAKGSATGATINSYNFKLNGTTVQNTKINTYPFAQTQPGTYTVSVTVHTDHGDADSPKCVQKVNVKPPKVAISCDSLSASKTDVQPGEQVVFTAHGSATNGANISTYEFFVNDVSQQNKPSNVYNFSQTQEGDYTVNVTVHTDHGDAPASDACVQKVKVHKEVKPPVPSCDLLTVTPASVNVGSAVTATAAFTAPTGVTFQQATFTFGDEATAADNTVTTQLDANGHAIATHSYDAVGTYKLTVAIDFMVNGQPQNGVTSEQCKAQVTVGAVLPAATELVNTGPGDVAGIFAGTTTAGAFLHRRWTLRKSAK